MGKSSRMWAGTKRVLFTQVPVPKFLQGRGKQLSAGVSRIGRRAFGIVLREPALEKLRSGEKPAKDLVLFSGPDYFQTEQADTLVARIASLRPSNERNELLQILADLVATSNVKPFELARKHFDFVDVDFRQNIWFSNKPRGIKIPKIVSNTIALWAKLRGADFSKPRGKRLLRGLRHMVASALIAFGLHVGLVSPVSNQIVERISKATVAEMDRIGREMQEIELAFNQFQTPEKKSELELKKRKLYFEFARAGLSGKNQIATIEERIKVIKIGIWILSPILLFGWGYWKRKWEKEK